MKLTTAKLRFNEHNTPESKDFGDLYFSNRSGVEECDYVFINGNRLWQRWLITRQSCFHIAETGFGTGLNFFRVAQLFMQFRLANPTHTCTSLHFFTTEKHPLDESDAIHVHHSWKQSLLFEHHFEIDFKVEQIIQPESNLGASGCQTINIATTHSALLELQQRFLADYPTPIIGTHRRHFQSLLKDCECNIALDIMYGDAIESFTNMYHQCFEKPLINAWFLDGFAPSKNQDMWHSQLYEKMQKLSQPNATFATFTAASSVRHSLLNQGFNVKKRKGFGRKREMLIGTINSENITKLNQKHSPKIAKMHSTASEAPYYYRKGLVNHNHTIYTIVGNGLAGAITAYKLATLGLKVELIWQGDIPADGASGNPIGGFYPQLNAQHNYASQIQIYSFLYAQHFYNSLANQQPFKHNWCGALQIGFNENTQIRLEKMQEKALWPSQIAHIVSAEQASDIAQIDVPYKCLFLPKAGWISPPSLVNSCIEAATKTGNLTLINNHKLLTYTPKHESVECTFYNKTISKEVVQNKYNLILAMGSDLTPMLDSVVPLRLTRGQVELVASQPSVSNLATLLCHKGYFTPSVDGYHALGSTYVKGDTGTDVRTNETAQNFETHLKSIDKANWKDSLAQLQNASNNKSRAAIRCASPDHLPVVGGVPSVNQFDELQDLYKALPVHKYPEPSYEPNVFVLTGLGSRGLTTAPLMAEILVSQILNKAFPLNAELLHTLSPNRFIVRSLIRQQQWN